MTSLHALLIRTLVLNLLLVGATPLEARSAKKKRAPSDETAAAASPAKDAPGTAASPTPTPAAPATGGTATPPATAPLTTGAGPEEADVQKIKEKYWARGNETEMGVVQNRLFTKRRRAELGLMVGNLNGDPFLKTTTLTASAGFHFTEFVSAHLLFTKAFVGASSALTTLQQQLATTANTNEPRWSLTGEARASVLYGKVSLLGAAILYFDAYFTGGLGYIKTESGGNALFTAGIGQQIHITQTYALNLAYKILWYRETILGKVGGSNGNLGQNLGSRSNLSNAISIGVSILLDPLPEEKKK